MMWWNDAVVYQVYVRSFADSTGDGVGDLRGLTSRLGHLASLGVDALWLNPCYTSPQRDHGYDISDYFTIDPAYGTVGDLAHLVTEAHAKGMRVLMDMVANHCSDQHAWFQAALAAGPGSALRERFLFRDGLGASGELPPNNWQSVFGGPAWTRVVEDDGMPGQWYFHAFDSSQPDFNWRCPEVANYFDEVIRFWFDLGVDGFRIDVAHGLFKTVELADWPGTDIGEGGHNYSMWDQPEVHDIYRRWRAIGNASTTGEKYFVGEIWVPSVESLAAYLQEDELHHAFSFDLLVQPWNASLMGAAIRRSLAQGALTGGPPAWTLSNHDVHRTSTRYGQVQDLSAPLPTDMIAAARRRGETDLVLGVQRARAAIMLQLALPGTVFLYQGEETGLPEVFDLPDSSRQDPIWLRSGGAELGRDGCRVPLPWERESQNFGFTPATDAQPWLPQPEWYGDFAVDQQQGDPASTLSLYTTLIALRRELFAGETQVEWLDTADENVLAIRRGPGTCIVNFTDTPFELPTNWQLEPVIASGPTDFGCDVFVMPANSAAWFMAVGVNIDSAVPLADGVRKNSASRELQSAAT